MNRNFQPLFISRSTVLLGVILLCAAFVSYGVIYLMISSQSSYTGQTVYELIKLMVWFAIALYSIIGSFFIIIVGLFVTHKVAGPLCRLEMTLDEAESGYLPGEVCFRKGDQLTPLADAQKMVFSYLDHRDQDVTGLWPRVKKSLDTLAMEAERATPEEWSRLVADLESECLALAEEAARQEEVADPPSESTESTKKKRRKWERGLTILELTTVLAIISIMAAITFPLIAGLKDKATWGAAKGNLATIRTALAFYALEDPSNKYPSSLTWDDLSSPTGFLNETNFPATMAAAKLSSMVYSTTAIRSDFTVVVTVRNRFSDTIRATPSEISPGTYPR